MSDYLSAKQIASYAVRQALEDCLAQCTRPQQDFFTRVYPDGVLDAKLEDAYELVQRTLKKNEAGR